MKQGVDTPNLRRSSRVRRCFTVFTPENDKQVTRKNPIARCENVKRKHESLEAKHEQEEPHLAPSGHEMHKSSEVEQEEQQSHLAPSGHEMHNSLEVEHEQQELPITPSVHDIPPVETRGEVPVVELLSPEEEKPKFDLLFLLEHAEKPISQEEISLEDRQHLVNAATVLKSQLVARLTSSADNLKTEDMIDLANRCFRALRELGDDYRSFNKDVYKFISQQKELEFAAKDMENWNDWDLRARYSHQERLMSDVTEKLFSAQDELSRTTSHADYLKFKKDELTSALLMVTEELSKEEQKIKTLTVKRDKRKVVQFDVEVGLEKLDTEKKEARVALEAINAQYDAAKEEFERMSNYLVQLVRRPPSKQAAEPSTTSFYTAELTSATSTVSPRPVCIGVSFENQAYGPGIGVSSELTSPSAMQSWFYDPSLNMFLVLTKLFKTSPALVRVNRIPSERIHW
ncbi:hypothetical protein POM88_034481 [Heracleum sosnowskyi]|uniref:Uncharacterized protein n=1 Tax=Heracleum sosnowskyi TaxID=360622 RepID=A0AAD8MD71_9APIA|nr:hypothetical protein POM88_034481 [Heracleum sosnowskyi]